MFSEVSSLTSSLIKISPDKTKVKKSKKEIPKNIPVFKYLKGWLNALDLIKY